MNWPFVFLNLLLSISTFAASPDLSGVAQNQENDFPLTTNEDGNLNVFDQDDKIELKIQVYGYPEVFKKTYSISTINPLQPETISLAVPGLTIAKLGTFGQKTSLVYNGFTSGDMTFLFDGFELSDVSDPSEGFDISSYMMSPDFDFTFAKGSSGLFYRQLGGGLSIDPKYVPGQTLMTSAGSAGQTMLSYQNNVCSNESCYQIGFGGTQADGLSASVNSRAGTDLLENDSSSLYYLSFGWVKSLSSKSLVKVRAHTQYSTTEIDDYDENFIFKDDKNASLNFFNQFVGLNYSNDHHQYFFENIYSVRNVANDVDGFSLTKRDDSYEVLRTKVRSSHQIKKFEINWFLQNINLTTKTIGNLENLNKVEVGFQADYNTFLKGIKFKHSANFNALQSFDFGVGLSQTLRTEAIDFSLQKNKKLALKISHPVELKESNHSKLYFQTQYGYKDRRPSFFQLFDPQFGNPNLTNERQFFFRPQIDLELSNDAARKTKHNISISYSLENMNSKVVFQNTNGGEYVNSDQLTLNNLTLMHTLEGLKMASKVFYRQSLDSESVTEVLPWTAQKEVGFGFSFRQRLLTLSADIKWLFEMSNPSQNKIQELVQSQMGVSYHIDTQSRINLQLNNVFNDKKIWDEGFNRQPFSWMMTLTKKI